MPVFSAYRYDRSVDTATRIRVRLEPAAAPSVRRPTVRAFPGRAGQSKVSRRNATPGFVHPMEAPKNRPLGWWSAPEHPSRVTSKPPQSGPVDVPAVNTPPAWTPAVPALSTASLRKSESPRPVLPDVPGGMALSPAATREVLRRATSRSALPQRFLPCGCPTIRARVCCGPHPPAPAVRRTARCAVGEGVRRCLARPDVLLWDVESNCPRSVHAAGCCIGDRPVGRADPLAVRRRRSRVATVCRYTSIVLIPISPLSAVSAPRRKWASLVRICTKSPPLTSVPARMAGDATSRW